MTVNKRPTRFRVTIETLSPLHIGTGNRLRREFEYVARAGKTWVIDQEALADVIYDEEGTDSDAWNDLIAGRKAGELLLDDDFRLDSRLFRYVLEGTPKSEQSGSEMQELIKDGFDRPYIPGSSLKGALRTAFLYSAYRGLKLTYDVNELDDKPKFAALPLERRIVTPNLPGIGKYPNYDLLRALHVTDSTPDAQRRMQVVNAGVFSKGEVGAPIVLECIPRGVTFEARISLDTALFEKNYADELRWDRDKQVKWLRNIRDCLYQHSVDRIEAELKYWHNRSAPMRDFYLYLVRRLEKINEDKSPEAVFQLGWGGGWMSKTFGLRLLAEREKFAQLIRRYQKDMLRNGRGTFKPDQAYPASRRVVVQDDAPFRPFGWVWMKMEREE